MEICCFVYNDHVDAGKEKLRYIHQTKTAIRHPLLISALLLFILTIAMFSDVLFTSRNLVLSSPNTDLAMQFIYWRDFGFSELKKGNLALWNPYIFSGMPFFGETQSALLYPLNLIYLLLPLARAINISIALHIFLAGIFMCLWLARRKLHPLACFLSAVLFMFCGAHFPHIYAGHLPNLCAIIWAPLIFLSIDETLRSRSLGWLLLGIFAAAMQILAGHPQYVFYTAVTAFLYFVFSIIWTRSRAQTIFKFFIIYAGAFALGAVQILSGIQAAAESIRSKGVSFAFASSFSLPPENLITFLVPGFFGDNISFPYWGRCYSWEMSLFLSITAFMLAIYGALYGKDKTLRNTALTLILFTLLLALGKHTPLFGFLYHWVPGFNLFRGNSKFIFPASLFIILLAGSGLNQIIVSQRIPKKITGFVFLAGILLLSLAFYLENLAQHIKNIPGLWNRLLQMIRASQESFFSPQLYQDPSFSRQAGLFTAEQLIIAGCTCLAIALLFYLRRFFRQIPYLIVLLAILEVFIFCRHSLAKFDPALAQPQGWKKFAVEHPGDYRILCANNPNIVMAQRLRNIWGYDPGILLRYAEFMAFSQGQDPDQATQYLNFSHYSKLYKILRCRYVFIPENGRLKILDTGDHLPRLLLIQNWLLLPRRDAIFSEIQKPAFNPYQTVILQEAPVPLPIESPEQTAIKIIDSSTDHLTIETRLSEPGILLVTDAYSTGWRARSLANSVQKQYKIMPADYFLCGVPLSKGYHHLRIEYMPIGFLVGKWISLFSLAIYLILVAWFLINRLKGRRSRIGPV